MPDHATHNVSEDQIISFILGNSFRMCDNIPRDAKLEVGRMHEEHASLLTCASIGTDQFRLLFGDSAEAVRYSFGSTSDAPYSVLMQTPFRVDFKLENETLPQYHEPRPTHLLINLDVHLVMFGDCDPNVSMYRGKRRYWTHVPSEMNSWRFFTRLYFHDKHSDGSRSEMALLSAYLPRLMQTHCSWPELADAINRILDRIGLFGILKNAHNSKHSTPGDVTRFFDTDPFCYGSSDPGCRMTHKLAVDDSPLDHGKIPERDGYDTLVTIPFYNHQNAIPQRAVVLAPPDRRHKLLLPFTAWQAPDGSTIGLFLPIPGKQPLLNAGTLHRREEYTTIILTDSVEVAHWSQEGCRLKGCAFLGFLPEGQYDSIDWNPLVEYNRTVYYLIANHSGKTLSEAYLKAGEVTSFLREKYGISVRYIQAEFRYEGDGGQSNPCLVKDSVMVLDQSRFDAICAKARERMRLLQIPIWMEQDESQGETGSNPSQKTQSAKKDPVRYLMRPFIRPGSISAIAAYQKVGKTSFAMSLCTCIAYGKEFLPSRVWTPCKPDGAEDSQRRVLYFYLEHDSSFDAKEKEFAVSYVPKDKNSQYRSSPNIVFVKSSDIGSLDFSVQADHPRILDLIKSKAGSPASARPFDLVVVDTYSAACRKAEHGHSWANARELFKSLTKNGGAVLLIHHTKDGGRGADMRGSTIKMDEIDTTITLSGSEGGTTLADGIWVDPGKSTDELMPFDSEPFAVAFKERKWEVVKRPNGLAEKALPSSDAMEFEDEPERARAFVTLAREYRAAGYKEIHVAMGLGHTQFSERLKTYTALVQSQA